LINCREAYPSHWKLGWLWDAMSMVEFGNL
jgi:hypothetical protein